jgi:hypothetical protein
VIRDGVARSEPFSWLRVGGANLHAMFGLRKELSLPYKERHMVLETQEAVAQALRRDPTLSENQAEITANLFLARVCGSDGDESFESLGDFLLRTENNMKALIERMKTLETAVESQEERKRRLKLPRRG